LDPDTLPWAWNVKLQIPKFLLLPPENVLEYASLTNLQRWLVQTKTSKPAASSKHPIKSAENRKAQTPQQAPLAIFVESGLLGFVGATSSLSHMPGRHWMAVLSSVVGCQIPGKNTRLEQPAWLKHAQASGEKLIVQLVFDSGALAAEKQTILSLHTSESVFRNSQCSIVQLEMALRRHVLKAST